MPIIVGPRYIDALGVLRVKGPPMYSAVGPRYIDALGVLRVKGPPMYSAVGPRYRDALGVLRGAALVRSEWRAAWTQ